MNEEDRLEEESERLQKEYEKRRSERLRGGATDEQINQAYKERQILDQQDPRTDEEFLKKRAEEGPDAGEVAKGVGFEIAAGLATDIATKPLLALPPLYALANFVSGAAANLIAQKLRGETKLSLGEILGSGAVGIIPGSQIKTGKTLSKIVGEAASGQRVLVSGAAQGIGGEAIRIGIDEQRLLTAKEAAFAGGTGGLVSRGFMEILNARKPALDYINRVLTKNVGPTGAPAADVFAAGSVGAAKRSNINQSSIDSEIDMKPFTLKFKPQQWEQYSKQFPNLFESSTGRPAKPDAPLDIGEITTLVPDVQRGKPIRTFQKQDIDLREFKIKKTPIQKVVERFRRRISALMQADRIRSTDAGTKDGFTKTSRNINNFTEGTNEISSMYYDYLVGYFNRFIRSGKVDNFEKAVNVIAPKVKGGEIVEGLQTLKGDAGLIRELRLFTIDPNVYKSDAFKIKGESYQAKLKSLIRQYNAAGAQELKETTGRFAGKYRFDGHHIDQIAEGWPLYRGLPKEEIPLMREMIRSYGLNPGNHPENVLILLNKLHKEYHAIYWPAALKRLKNSSTGWDIDELQKIKTAEGRRKWVENYVRETLRSRDEVIQKASNLLDSYAAVQETTLNELTEAQINRLSKDVVDPLLAKPTPKGIKQEIDKDFPLDED